MKTGYGKYMLTDEEILKNYCRKESIPDKYRVGNEKVIMGTYSFQKYRLNIGIEQFYGELSKAVRKHGEEFPLLLKIAKKVKGLKILGGRK